MKAELEKYRGLKICVAVSGGKDSVALLHYVNSYAKKYEISLSALNCDHAIRANSARDSAFVVKLCKELSIPLLSYKREGRADISELQAREWRISCYAAAAERGAVVIATAHHINDNAETVIFNLARGSSVTGLQGITDKTVNLPDGKSFQIIRPFIECTRSEIDEYVAANKLQYVEDETNFTDDYTRNRIRHNVLPELEKAVPQAVRAIYRLSRLAAEDGAYFDDAIKERNLIAQTPYGIKLSNCVERPIFKRAAVEAVAGILGRKDYTAEHAERLYGLQFSENGKKFEFLNLTAYKENDCIFIGDTVLSTDDEILYNDYSDGEFFGQRLILSTVKPVYDGKGKLLKFDCDKITDGAVIRFARDGDKFTKFGGGTKNLGDYFTDKKIPVRLRKKIPLIAEGNDILVVCGIEISDKVKITEETQTIKYIYGNDYTKEAE